MLVFELGSSWLPVSSPSTRVEISLQRKLTQHGKTVAKGVLL